MDSPKKSLSNELKIAISATEKNINSNVSNIFGRCPYFIIAEIKNQKIKKSEAIENKNINQRGGVGVLTAQLIAKKNVNTVITGNVGPRAFDVLKQFKIKIYSGEGTIKEVLEKFVNGKLKRIED